MNKKWWRYAIIGVLLFDLCLVAIQAGSIANQEKNTAPWPQGLQNVEVSFEPSSPTAKTAEKLTVTTVFLLTAMTLM
jgi:hypothetical protein